MWVAKVQLNSEGTLIGSKAKKYNIDLFVFPLSYSYENNYIIVHITGILQGLRENIESFIKELKKENRVENLELNNDFLIATIREPSYTKHFYNKDVIHLAPTLISGQGYEVGTIGSFKKEKLIKLVKLIKKKYSGELLSIQQKKVKSISITRLHPDLTDKQKQAMGLAIKHGYYISPRKTDLKTLARISKLSFSTFQVHLRKAEEKLMPYFFE